MAKSDTPLFIDSTQLIGSLFTLLPVPVAIVDEDDRIVMANSSFHELLPDAKTTSHLRMHETLVPGRGTFEFEKHPLNDQGLWIVLGIDITKEVSLRRQLTQLEQQIGHRTERVEPSTLSFDLNDAMRSVAKARRSSSQAPTISLSLELNASLPLIKGDSAEMERALTGLIANAEQSIMIANRRSGAIHVKTWSDNNRVRLSVCDNGCGLGARDIPQSGADQALPVGLCAAIIKDLGGELFCWSSYDAGSTYTLELPVNVDRPAS